MTKKKNDKEELNLDDIQFKPLSDGLGFRHPQKPEKILEEHSAKGRIGSSVFSLENKSQISMSPQVKEAMQLNSHSALSAFYGEQKSSVETSFHHEDISINEVEQKSFMAVRRVLAFITDLAFVSLNLGLAILIVWYKMKFFLNSIDDFLVLLPWLSFIYFFHVMIYFTFIESGGRISLGKKIFSLELKAEGTARPTAIQCLVRFLIVSSAFVSFGLSLLVFRPDRISATRVEFEE